jgi:hypothetical protein
MTIQEYFTELEKESALFREKVSEVEKTDNDEEIMEEQIKRGEFKGKLRKLTTTIADKIGELESLKRKLRDMSYDQSTDIDTLDKRKWEIIHSRKVI